MCPNLPDVRIYPTLPLYAEGTYRRIHFVMLVTSPSVIFSSTKVSPVFIYIDEKCRNPRYDKMCKRTCAMINGVYFHLSTCQTLFMWDKRSFIALPCHPWNKHGIARAARFIWMLNLKRYIFGWYTCMGMTEFLTKLEMMFMKHYAPTLCLSRRVYNTRVILSLKLLAILSIIF